MKTYIYTVRGMVGKADEDKVAEIVKSLLDVAECAVSATSSTVTLTVDDKIYSQDKIEELLAPELEKNGYELISPPNINNYAYVGDKKRKPAKKVSLSSMIAAIAVTAVFCILFTYVVAFNALSPGYSGVSDGEYPEYLDELNILDDVFKNFYYYDIDDEEIGEQLLKAYVYATKDKYAEYYNAEEYAQLMQEDAGNMVGIGVSIVNSTIEINGCSYKVLQIISVYEGTPAYENGVMVGDCIMFTGSGDDKESVDSLGYTMALDKLSGEVGSYAEFTVYRPDSSQASGYKEVDFSIQRAEFVTQSVSYEVCTTDNKVGIVKISQFDLTTPVQFSEAVDSLIENGCEYFIFDVRNNPGGDLKSIEAVLSYFLEEGDLIVSTEDKGGVTAKDYVKAVRYTGNYEGCSVAESDIGKYRGLKLAVLTNGNTASAAELFTATIRDYNLGPIVGTKTYGKGCMQYIIPLERYGLEGALRVTTAMYFSASHTVYHDIGITPDYTEELSDEAKDYNLYLLPHDKDNQLQRAIGEIKK